MRLLSLDFDPVYGEDTTRSTFAGDLSVFDYDVVIWDPSKSFDNYAGYYSEQYQGLPALADDLSVQIQGDAKRRRKEFIDFVNSGRTLIVIASPPQDCYVATGTHEYSGSGRNRVTTRHVMPFDLLSALPISGATFRKASGDRIELDGEGPMVEILRKYRKYLSYRTTIESPPGVVVAHVAGTDRTVSSIQRSKGSGHLIILPEVSLEADPTDDEEAEDDERLWVPDAPAFQHDLLAAIEQMTGSGVISRPEWASRYATAEQEQLSEDIVQQQKKVATAKSKLATLQQEKAEGELRDQLYLGSGRVLELEVKGVFELLGGTVTEPTPGRDDWRVTFPEGTAVVEVKGLTKSAAEKNAAQLEKWVAGVLEETGKPTKGVLVVNTWRDTPLSERTKDDFPNQMLAYSKSRGHCLVTGLQLYVIRAEVAKDPSRAEYWRKKLLESSGPIQGARNWQAVIQQTQSGEE